MVFLDLKRSHFLLVLLKLFKQCFTSLVSCNTLQGHLQDAKAKLIVPSLLVYKIVSFLGYQMLISIHNIQMLLYLCILCHCMINFDIIFRVKLVIA